MIRRMLLNGMEDNDMICMGHMILEKDTYNITIKHNLGTKNLIGILYPYQKSGVIKYDQILGGIATLFATNGFIGGRQFDFSSYNDVIANPFSRETTDTVTTRSPGSGHTGLTYNTFSNQIHVATDDSIMVKTSAKYPAGYALGYVIAGVDEIPSM